MQCRRKTARLVSCGILPSVSIMSHCARSPIAPSGDVQLIRCRFLSVTRCAFRFMLLRLIAYTPSYRSKDQGADQWAAPRILYGRLLPYLNHTPLLSNITAAESYGRAGALAGSSNSTETSPATATAPSFFRSGSHSCSSRSTAHSYMPIVLQAARSGLAPDAYWQGPHVRRSSSRNAIPHATAGTYTLVDMTESGGAARIFSSMHGPTIRHCCV